MTQNKLCIKKKNRYKHKVKEKKAMLLKSSISLMEWILDKTDIGFCLTPEFEGNILIIGGSGGNSSNKLFEKILKYAPKCSIYHFDMVKIDTVGERYHHIYCNLYHRHGFTNSISHLNRKYYPMEFSFNIFINLTLLLWPRGGSEGQLFLNVISFQNMFNKCIINPIKAIKYVVGHGDGKYIINISQPLYHYGCKYKDIDRMTCANAINQFHDSLSSELNDSKCLLIYWEKRNEIDMDMNTVMKCLQGGYEGEYHMHRSYGIKFIINETYGLISGWM